MKKIDKIIIKILISALSAVIIWGVFFYPFLSLKFLAGLIIGVYFSFLTFHLALCYPLFVIIDVILTISNSCKIMESINNKSKILRGLALAVFIIIALTFIYICIPIIATMLWYGIIDPLEALKIIKEYSQDA